MTGSFSLTWPFLNRSLLTAYDSGAYPDFRLARESAPPLG